MDTNRCLGEIITELTAALNDERRASDRADELVLTAKSSGVTWVELTELTGQTITQLRWRAQRAAGPEARPTWVAERRRRAAAGEPRPGRATRDPRELTIAETARRLGVARPTIYVWIKRGRLPGAGERGGMQFVQAEADGTVRLIDA